MSPPTVTLARPIAIATPATRALYLQNWDRLRVIAALDTVAHHLTGAHALFGFGLPLFLMLSVALSVARPGPPPTRRFVTRRIDRVVWPWLFWAAVLTALRTYFAVTTGHEPFGWVEWPMVLYGPRIHLWFLPFVVVAGVLAHLIHLRSQGRHALLSAGIALVIGVALLPLPPRVLLVWPFDQWLFSVPSIALGYALGRAVSTERSLPRLRLLLTSGYAAFGLLAGAVVLLFADTGPYVLRYVGGLGLLVVATWLPNTGDRITKRIAPLMLGVYMLHPGVYSIILKPILLEIGLEHLMWLRLVTGFFATMGLVALLRWTKIKRFL